jgi:hypothetical protein
LWSGECVEKRKSHGAPDKKKSLEQNALRIAPCLLDPYAGLPDISAYGFTKRHQAGLLAHGSPYSPALPISKRQWFYRISSPFTAAGPLPILTGFPIKLVLYLMLKNYVTSFIQVIPDAVNGIFPLTILEPMYMQTGNGPLKGLGNLTN